MTTLSAFLATAVEPGGGSLGLSILAVFGGLFLLSVGGESLVSGASRLALHFRLTPTVIGLTVVAAGTSLPELVVSVIAQYKGSADLAVGNVIGSNTFNIGMVLGVLALFKSLPIPGSTAKLEFPVLLVVTLAIYPLALGSAGATGVFSRPEGIGMLIALIVFIAVTIRVARKQVTREEASQFEEEVSEVSGVDLNPDIPLAWAIGQVVLGAAGLWLGGKWLIDGSVGVAQIFEVPERIIAVTIVAGGTGAPELVASIIAIRRGKGDLAVGNVIGSNLFNLLGILGCASVVSPLAASKEIMNWDYFWMAGITLLLIPFFFRSSPGIRRLEGGLILGAYVGYIASLIIRG